MINISLTDFIDFVSKSGTTKYSKVKEIKNRDEYHPAFDFWKPLREAIIDLHKYEQNRNVLDKLINRLTDQKKIKLYPSLIKQYKSFLGRKKIEWFEPPFKEWKIDELRVRLNPEIGLLLDDKPFIIKLYFKAEPLSKAKTETSLLLLNSQMRVGDFEDFNFAILDVSQKKLYDSSKLDYNYLALLEGEASSLIKIWNNIK